MKRQIAGMLIIATLLSLVGCAKETKKTGQETKKTGQETKKTGQETEKTGQETEKTGKESVNPKLYQRRLKFMDSGRHFGKDLTNQNNSKPSSLSKKPTITSNSQEKVSKF